MPFSNCSCVTSTSLRAKSGVPSAFMQAETIDTERSPSQSVMRLLLVLFESAFEPSNKCLLLRDNGLGTLEPCLPASEPSALVFQADRQRLLLSLVLQTGHR